VGCTSDS